MCISLVESSYNSVDLDDYYPRFQMEKLSPVVLLAIISGQMLTLHCTYFMKPFLTASGRVKVSYSQGSQGPLLKQLPHSQEQ